MAKPRRKNKKKQRISPLLALPREIRDDIFYYALDWPNLNNTFKMLEGREAMLEEEHRKLHPKQPRCRLPKPRMQFQTPGILLANQQIYAEAIDVLRQKPLIIPGPPPLCYATGREYDITDVVGEETLQNAPYVTLEIDFLYWSWDHVVDSLLELWSVKQSLRMLFVKVSRKPIAGHVALDLPLDSSKYRFSPGRHGFIHTTILSRVGCRMSIASQLLCSLIYSQLLHLSYEVPITVEGCEGELFDYRMVKGYGNGRYHPFHSM
jgi:hypothetical protein